MKYATKKSAKEYLEANKDFTAYFTGELNMKDMHEMLRDMGFGAAETNVILSTLIMAGAKFKID